MSLSPPAPLDPWTDWALSPSARALGRAGSEDGVGRPVPCLADASRMMSTEASSLEFVLSCFPGLWRFSQSQRGQHAEAH